MINTQQKQRASNSAITTVGKQLSFTWKRSTGNRATTNKIQNTRGGLTLNNRSPPTRKDINMSSPAAPAATTDAGDGLASQHKLKSPAHTMETTQHWKTGTTSLSIHGSTTQRLHTVSTESNINNTTESSNANTTRSRRMDTVGSQLEVRSDAATADWS